MTVTEASRHFSDLPDAVEHGEILSIMRGNHPVAEFGPPTDAQEPTCELSSQTRHRQMTTSLRTSLPLSP